LYERDDGLEIKGGKMYHELDKGLTVKQRLLKETAHEFAKGVIRPAGVAADQMNNPEEYIKGDSIWWEARKKMRQMKYHLAGFPKSLGGFEAGPLDLHILLEEFAWGSLGLGLSIFLDSFPAMMVLTYKPEDKTLIDDIVMPFVNDLDAKITACTGIAEPNHSSDALFCFRQRFHDPKLAFETKAVLQGDKWVINGQKAAWVSNGPVATHTMTFLTVYQSEGIVGGGIALIPMDSPGVTRGKPMVMLGSRDFPQCEIFLRDVRIPRNYMLVGPDLFETAIDRLLCMAGVSVGAATTGLARAAFEEALEYSKHRVQGGKPIVEHQITALKLFDMFTNVEAARAFSRAAMEYCLTTADSVPREYGAATKVFCTQVAYKVACEALQIHGAYGLAKESLVGKLFRDARGQLVGDGCNEVLGLKGASCIVENYNPLE
jgi:alkylation response protein AidB-like acyl-CoA dehydrogenase